MEMFFCLNCGKVTGHKRAVGVGTLLGAVATAGVSLAAIPFYPLRCVVCGSTRTAAKPNPHVDLSNNIDVDWSDNIDYQSWVEEFIYRFGKAVTKVQNDSGNPVEDWGLLAYFFNTIKEKSIETSNIRGLENKAAFEKAFLEAQNLLTKLESTPEFQDYLQQLAEQQPASQLENQRQHTPEEACLMDEHGITFNGSQYVYEEYRYDKLCHAVDYAKKVTERRTRRY